MPMLPIVAEDLNKEEQSDFHKEILKRVRDNVNLASQNLSRHFTTWDYNEDVFQSRVTRDDQDKKASERKEPEKLILPMTYSQIMTWVAFAVQMYTQRPTFFELDGTGMEDHKAAKIAEALLDRDLEESKFIIRLFQFLLDLGRFGRGIYKVSWWRETQKQWQNQQVPMQPAIGQDQPGMFQGQQAQQMLQLVDVVRFLGNRIRNVSPYRFYFDPRVTITDLQEGEFCASEEDVSKNWLRRQEKNGIFAGTKFIKDFGATAWTDRIRHTRTGIKYDAADSKQSAVLFTEMQMDIVPSEFKVDGSKPLGNEDYPIKYLCVVANDSRLIRCEPLGYLHDHFTYYAAEFTPDMHTDISSGIADLISELSNVISWLFNSRIRSVRKTIQNQLVVDPQGVEMRDIENRNPIIRLKKGVSASGVDRWIKQLQVTDVTASHISDIGQTLEMMRLTTGINENASGQYSKGRRSAEQTQSVNAAGSMRLVLPARLAHAAALRPMGMDMLSNLRDGLDEKQLVRVCGLQLMNPQTPYAPGPLDAQQFLQVDKTMLIGAYDFLPLDTTQPSQKQDRAMMLQELLDKLVQNPQALVIMGIDAKAILQEVLELLGIRNPERFNLSITQQQALIQAAQMMAQVNPAGAQQTAGPAVSAGVTSQTAALPQNSLQQMLMAPQMQQPQMQ